MIEISKLKKQLDAECNPRPAEDIIAQYEYERAAAQRLMQSKREERRHLYTSVYEELFRRFPDHPELRVDPAARWQQVEQQAAKVRALCRPDMTFLEIGAGDCRFAYAIAPCVKTVYALEVTEAKLPKETPPPSNFKLLTFDGFDFPLPDSSIDFAYTNQVIEHLHPEDVEYHLREVYRVLCVGGYYLCITPHRFVGPCDISRYFTREATALHLREYTYHELSRLMQRLGFKKQATLIGNRVMPLTLVLAMERTLENLPYSLRKSLATKIPAFRASLKIIGYKQTS